MGLFDRLVNPLWHRIETLESAQKDDLCNVICLVGFFRATLDDSLVKPLEKLCQTSQEPALRLGTKAITPVTPDKRQQLVDEALLGFLCSCRRSGLPTDAVTTFDPMHLPGVIGTLALAEINSRLGRQSPALLAGTGYSADPDAARTQVLLAWMKILDLTDANFVGIVAATFFEEQWAICTSSLLSGALKGMKRNSATLLHTRARSDCASMSANGRAVVTAFLDARR